MGAKPDNCAGQEFVCVKQLTRQGKAWLAFNFLLISLFEIPIHSVNLDPTPSTTTQSATTTEELLSRGLRQGDRPA